MKKCPFCAEEIQDEAIVCRFCGRDLATPQPVAMQESITPQVAAAPPTSQPDLKIHNGKTLLLIGGLGIIAGSLLPWATVSGAFGLSRTVNGYEGDGVISAAIGVFVFLCAFSKPKSILAMIVTGLGSLICGWIAVDKLFALSGQSSDSVSISIGIGLPILIIAAFLSLIGAFGINKPKIA